MCNGCNSLTIGLFEIKDLSVSDEDLPFYTSYSCSFICKRRLTFCQYMTRYLIFNEKFRVIVRGHRISSEDFDCVLQVVQIAFFKQ